MQRLETHSVERPTVDEWFTNPFVHIVQTSDHLGWNNVHVQNTELNAIPFLNVTPESPDDVLVLMREGECRMEGVMNGRPFREQYGPGTLFTIPRGADIVNTWDASVKVDFVLLHRPAVHRLVSEVTRGDPEHIEIESKSGFQDALLRSLTIALHNELSNQSYFGNMLAESITNTIVLRLLANYSNAAALKTLPRERRLTAVQMCRVNDYIQAHLDQKISLSDLADCLNISIPHFERLFRATLHRPPYQYVLEQKIERAKHLLCDPRQSIFDVALACGFANQSHFTKHFTRLVGITPARYVHAVQS